MKTKPVRHFQVGYIHNPVNFLGALRLIMCFNVSNNFTQGRNHGIDIGGVQMAINE